MTQHSNTPTADRDPASVLLLLLLMGPVLLWKGFLFHHIWNWFVVPLGFPLLGTLGACGVLIVADWLRTSKTDMWQTTQIPARQMLSVSLGSFFTFGLAFLFAWLVAALGGLT